jgi:hypothetical protein
MLHAGERLLNTVSMHPISAMKQAFMSREWFPNPSSISLARHPSWGLVLTTMMFQEIASAF